MEEYGIKLKVTADTAEAKAEMDALLAEKAQRVKEAAAATSTSGGAVAPGGASEGAGRSTGRAAAQEFERGTNGAASRIGRRLGAEFEKAASSGSAGQAIAKAVAGFALHQGLQAALTYARTPGADNTNVDRAGAVAGGAIQFGTMGAALGGPWGAAIGALVGGVTGLVQKMGEERNRRADVRRGMDDTAASLNQGILDSLGGEAKNRLLAGMGGRNARVDWLKQRADDLGRRQRASAAALNEVAGIDPTSDAFKERKAEFDRLSSAYAAARAEEGRERMKPLYDPFSAGDFGDSFSKRGLGAGPTVDMAAANQPIIQQQERMVQALEELVRLADEGAGSGGKAVNEAFAAIASAI